MDNENAFTFDQLVEGLGPIIFESIKIPFGIFNINHKVIWANTAMAALHRLSQEAFIGQTCYRACHGRTEPCRDCHIQEARQTGKVQIVEQWYEFPGRPKTWGEVHYYPIRGNAGDVAAIIVFGFDVTDRKDRVEVLTNYSKYLSGKLNRKSGAYQKIQAGDGEAAIHAKLSNREKEILRMLTEGYTNVQISALLAISINTVKTHVNNIFNKFGVNDRTHAAVIATRHNIV